MPEPKFGSESDFKIGVLYLTFIFFLSLNKTHVLGFSHLKQSTPIRPLSLQLLRYDQNKRLFN